MKIKILSTGNIILADESFAQAKYPNDYEIIPEDADPTPVETPPVYEWYIDVGSFMDRFGDQLIPILSSTDATVQALIKNMQSRQWIDLQLPQVSDFLDLLLSQGFTIDKTAILTTPVTPQENLVLRKLYF